ncbi:MAG: hypothetical protein J0L55_01530 [Caulobacterales bacterium]|nr:hypothetical protein [Caulobacterales bacterium]MCA0373971.1 hypothetical protein [Pseudomonadota bacterium]
MGDTNIKVQDIFRASLIGGAAASSILVLFFIVFSFLLFPLGIAEIGRSLLILLIGTFAGLITFSPIFFIVGAILKKFYREKYFNKLIIVSNISCIYLLIFFMNVLKNTHNNNVHEMYSEPIAKAFYIFFVTFSAILGSIIFLRKLEKNLLKIKN